MLAMGGRIMDSIHGAVKLRGDVIPMRRRTFLKLGATCAASGALSMLAPIPASAEEAAASGSGENSWRYKDGVPIQQDDGIALLSDTPAWSYNGSAWVNQFGDVCPNVIARGIDVSEWQEDINWEKVRRNSVTFAIIRCGVGSINRSDHYWEQNASECERLGIPFGAYFYSHATNADEARSEAQLALSIIGNHRLSYPVFFDMEDKDLLGRDYAGMARAFCSTIENAGLTTGVYANLNWWNTYLTDSVFNNWTRWIAQYPITSSITAPKYSGSYRFWQTSSTGRVDGVNGNVDLNFQYALTQEEIAAGTFYDTLSSSWYMRDGWVQYVASAGLMRGSKDSSGNLTGYFRPNENISRGEVATIFYRCCNPGAGDDSPADYGTVSNFMDVSTGRYYTKAIEWCRANGVVTGDKQNGQETGYFRPDDNVSREEFATMAYRLADFSGASMGVSGTAAFESMLDSSSVASFARDAMIWCADHGVLTGSVQSNGVYAYPQRFASRAEAAKIVTVLNRDVIA